MKFRDFIKKEFIGLWVEIVDAKNKDLIGLRGEIIDETKNTFKIKTEKGIKTVIKEQAVFLFYYRGYVFKIDGKLLVGRPWDRLKREVRK